MAAEIHGDGDRKLLILAAIHGDEAAGVPLVNRLSSLLSKNALFDAYDPALLVAIRHLGG